MYLTLDIKLRSDCWSEGLKIILHSGSINRSSVVYIKISSKSASDNTFYLAVEIKFLADCLNEEMKIFPYLQEPTKARLLMCEVSKILQVIYCWGSVNKILSLFYRDIVIHMLLLAEGNFLFYFENKVNSTKKNFI